MSDQPDEPTTLRPEIAKHFPPIDWTKSQLGRDVWEAWNLLDGAIRRLACAQLHDMSKRAIELEEAQERMRTSLRDRDRQPDMSADPTADPLVMKPSGFSDTKRLQRGDCIVGLVQECANGKWMLEDMNGTNICATQFRNPTAAWREAEKIGLGL